MPVYHGIKTIFVRVPKTASTSLCEKLYSGDCYARYFRSMETSKHYEETEKHESIRQIKQNVSETCFNDYYKVGFVRNPWSWLVSYYSYHQTDALSRKGVLADGHYQQRQNRFKGVPFRDFLGMVEEEELNSDSEGKGSQLKRPFQPQYNYLIDMDGKLAVDFVGRYENLAEDWRLLCGNLSLTQNRHRSMELQHHNTSNHSDYKTYYSDKEAEVVRRIYEKDILMFGYSF